MGIGMQIDVESSFLKNSNYRILESLFKNAPLKTTLAELIRIIESEREGMICSVLLLSENGEYLKTGAAPSLPSFYCQAIDGVIIGDGVGSCGTAAFTGQRVIVADINTHPYWTDFKALAQQAELAACWSQPIFSAEGQILGTFAMYYSEPIEPTEMDLNFIEHSARLASMVIERDKNQMRQNLVDKMIMDMPQSMVIVNSDNQIIECNYSFEKLSGFSKREVLNLNLFETFMCSGQEDLMSALRSSLKKIGAWRGESIVQDRGGRQLIIDATVSIMPTDDNSQGRNTVVFFDDITERKNAERLIYQQANYDQLTRLPNRKKFYDILAEKLLRIRHHNNIYISSQNSPFAVIMLDLDFFKEVNDTLGHYLGDRVLVDVAKRIDSVLGSEDVVARLGGDEFACIVDTPLGLCTVEEKCQAISAAFKHSFSVDGVQDLYISVSIGVSQYLKQPQIDLMLKQADQALFHVKKRGRDSFQVFTDDMREKAEYFARLHQELKISIEKQEIDVHFQPIFSIETGALVKFEALARWHHKDLGQVSPETFINTAEKNGLMPALGNLIRTKAFNQFNQWYQAGFEVGLSVNVSQREFSSQILAQHIVDQIDELKLPHQLLTVEITESLFNRHDDVLPQLSLLRDNGMSVSIDDFGTGYSSLSYISNFPINELKIDRSFIMNCVSDAKQQSLIEAMIMIAKQLDLRIVAEGIEDNEQLSHLRDKKCTLGQGYLYSKPIPSDQVMGFVKSKMSLH